MSFSLLSICSSHSTRRDELYYCTANKTVLARASGSLARGAVICHSFDLPSCQLCSLKARTARRLGLLTCGCQRRRFGTLGPDQTASLPARHESPPLRLVALPPAWQFH